MLNSVLGPSLQERHGGCGACPEKVSEAVKDLEHKSDGERLRELWLFSMEEQQPRRDLIALYDDLKGDGRGVVSASSPR